MIGAATVWRRLVSGIATAAAVFVMARSSAAPLPYHVADSARLRLSLSARPERIEVCRTLSAAELAERAEHMRQRVECDGRFATYSLGIEADGRRIEETVVRGAGLRNDRPMYVLRDFALSPGTHRIRVTLTRRERTDDDAAAFAPAVAVATDTGLFAGRAGREAAEHARRARAAIPARLVLDTVLRLAPRHLTIVTFVPERRTLEVVAEARAR